MLIVLDFADFKANNIKRHVPYFNKMALPTAHNTSNIYLTIALKYIKQKVVK